MFSVVVFTDEYGNQCCFILFSDSSEFEVEVINHEFEEADTIDLTDYTRN